MELRDIMNLIEAAASRYATDEPDTDWRERARKRNNTDDTVHPDPDAEKLKRHLLAIGGWMVTGLDDPDREAVMSRGQVWDGRNVYSMPGRPSSCHANTARLWEQNPKAVKICTGYALSQDGVWRVHSWGLHKGRPVETTEKRIAYFGLVMTDTEARRFAANND